MGAVFEAAVSLGSATQLIGAGGVEVVELVIGRASHAQRPRATPHKTEAMAHPFSTLPGYPGHPRLSAPT